MLPWLSASRIPCRSRVGCPFRVVVLGSNPVSCDCVVGARQEQEACQRKRGIRRPQPAVNCPAAKRVHGIERDPIRLDASSGSPRLADGEEPARPAGGRPAALGSDARCQPCLSIMSRNGRLEVRDDRLDLDDDEGPRWRVESQHVDGAALPGDRERNLDGHVPAERSETPGDELDERRVVGIEQSIERFTVPRQTNIEARRKRRHHPLDRCDGQAVAMPELDQGDRRSADTGRIGEIRLPPPAPAAERPNLPPETYRIHASIVVNGAYRAPIGRFRRARTKRSNVTLRRSGASARRCGRCAAFGKSRPVPSRTSAARRPTPP